jgi:hypothetical protein
MFWRNILSPSFNTAFSVSQTTSLHHEGMEVKLHSLDPGWAVIAKFATPHKNKEIRMLN